jgi:hypothetical protein
MTSITPSPDIESKRGGQSQGEQSGCLADVSEHDMADSRI